MAFDQRQVHAVAGGVLEGMGGEFAIGSQKGAAAFALHQRIDAAAVRNQVGDGANFEAVFGGKQLQIGQARHGAVVFHDLADHRSWRATRHGGQVAAGFGVAGAHQYPAVHRLQGEDVAGLHQVASHRARRYGGLHGARAVGSGYAGGYPLCGFDGHGEGRAFFVSIARRHGRQLQQLAACAGEGETNQTAAKAGHEVNGLVRDMVGGEYQVAFVLAVFFVHQDNDLARAHVGHDVFNRGDCHGLGGGGGGRHGTAFANTGGNSGEFRPHGAGGGLSP